MFVSVLHSSSILSLCNPRSTIYMRALFKSLGSVFLKEVSYIVLYSPRLHLFVQWLTEKMSKKKYEYVNEWVNESMNKGINNEWMIKWIHKWAWLLNPLLLFITLKTLNCCLLTWHDSDSQTSWPNYPSLTTQH